MSQPVEETAIHTRLLKTGLMVDESRAYWSRRDPRDDRPLIETAFAEYWFGDKSHARVKVVVANMKARYDAFADGLSVLRQWGDMRPDTRALICHWHLQLSDPMYRSFTGELLPSERSVGRHDITRDRVVSWVSDQGPGRWTMTTRIQLASKLLSCAYNAGIIGSNRDPRPLIQPTVPDGALTYLLYLLRVVKFDGTLLDNPYLASVGLKETRLDDRLRTLPDLSYRRMGELTDFGWVYPRLHDWAEASL